MPLPDEDDADL